MDKKIKKNDQKRWNKTKYIGMVKSGKWRGKKRKQLMNWKRWKSEEQQVGVIIKCELWRRHIWL